MSWLGEARDAIAISWMPPWVPRDGLEALEVRGEGGAPVSWPCLRPRPGAWDALARGLMQAGAALRAMPVAAIVDAIDRAARCWCARDWPVRVAARDRVVLATGMSAETVDRSLDVELRNYRAESLWPALRRELGDPRVLDGFWPVDELGGLSMALGPRLLVAIFTGNVPGLPALSLVRGLLVKAPILAKVAGGEPTFAAAFVRSLAEIEPRLGDAVALTYWARDDGDTLAAALAQADAIIAYGGDQACAAVRAAAGPHQRVLEHGHRLSFGLLSRAHLTRAGHTAVAAEVARDASMFDQHACIAPQAYLVEGSADEVRGFGAAVATAMATYARACPPGRLSPGDAAGVQMQRASATWRASAVAASEVWYPAGLDWTVICDERLGELGGGHRVLRLVPVASPEAAVARLAPLARHLQNLALGLTGAEMAAIAPALARLGAVRLCAPGRMSEPSLMWRHDGRPCIAELVRWCDVEMHPWPGPAR